MALTLRLLDWVSSKQKFIHSERRNVVSTVFNARSAFLNCFHNVSKSFEFDTVDFPRSKLALISEKIGAYKAG